MKKVICLLFAVLCNLYPVAALGNGLAGTAMHWEEQFALDKAVVRMDAAVDTPALDTLSVWEVAPAIIEKNVDELYSELFQVLNFQKQEYQLVEDYASEDRERSLYEMNYAQEDKEGYYKVLTFSYIKRLSFTGMANVYYSYDALSNGADFQSALKKAGETLPGMQRSLHEVVEEATEVVGRFAPEFELFMAGSLTREALTAVEKRDPDTIPKMYGLIYTRRVDGIPLLYHYASSEELPLSYEGLDMPDESISIMIGDRGIADLHYEGALQRKGVLQAQVGLLSFDRIKEIAREKLLAIANAKSDGIYKAETQISSVRLGYQLTALADGTGRMALIPAWNFYGGTAVYDQSGSLVTGCDTSDCISVCQLSLDAATGDVLDHRSI